MTNQKNILIVILLIGVVTIAAGCSEQTSDSIFSTGQTESLIVLFDQGQPVSVPVNIPEELDRHDLLAFVGKAIAQGVSGENASPLFPKGSELEKVELLEKGARYFVRLPKGKDGSFFTQELSDRLTAQFINTFYPLGEVGAQIYLATHDGEFSPASSWLPKLPPVEPKPYEAKKRIKRKAMPHIGSPQYPGFLSGKSIFVSAGHGWYWTGSSWLTQRGNTNDIVEDLSNVESVNIYLLQYLYNAGASVWPCRERDMNTNEVIVDNSDPGFSTTGTWNTSTAVSGYWGSDYSYATVAASESATATWTPDIPEDGWYHVYTWYTGGSNRSLDAKFIVNHPAGQAEVIVDQQLDAFTFKHLGKYYFYAGTDTAIGSVTLSNEGSDTSQVVIADAVRFGGGMGSIDPGGGTSGRPRYEESGRYFAEFMGCPSCNTGTVSSMPRYADWESELGEDSVYVSWHTNAPNPGTGTSSFVYSSYGWDGAFNGIAGSMELQDFVHAEIINDIRTGYDSNWTDRGQHTANFGEINPSYNDDMPGVLLEMAFHDTPSDADNLKDPKFREICARALYQGIVKYFADRDGVLYTLLPEPPTDLSVVVEPTGILISWASSPYNNGDGFLGDEADGYRIYTSPDGRAFSLETTVKGKGTTAWVGKATPPLYVRVTAYNDGGESLPTEALVSSPNPGPQSEVLIVNGFDRLSVGQFIDQYESSALGWVLRMFIERMNTYDYVRQYATPINDFGITFDSATNEAALDMDLTLYDLVIWIVGEDSTADETLSDDEQALLAAYMDAGGSLLISGAELGWDLDWLGSSTDLLFYNNYLNAQMDADFTGTYGFEGLTGTLFEGVSGFYDDSTHGTYDVEWPDIFTPLNGAACVMEFNPGECAALQFDSGYKLLYFGFPLETVYDETVRRSVLRIAMSFFLNRPIPPTDLVFFRAVDATPCVGLEWDIPSDLDAAYFMPLFADNEDGFGAVPLAPAPIIADNLLMDYRYSYLHCAPPYDGYYFLDVTLTDDTVWRYGPLVWPAMD